MPTPSLNAPSGSDRGGVVRALPFSGDDVALVAGLQKRHPGATEAFYYRFVDAVQGILVKILGPDGELEDLVHDVFTEALAGIHTLKEPQALRQWLLGVAVCTARRRIQKRRRRWWLNFLPHEEVPERASFAPEVELTEALRKVYELLDSLPVEGRIALVLRRVEQMTLPEAAQMTHVSLATFKRRLKRAELAFLALAEREPALKDWLGTAEIEFKEPEFRGPDSAHGERK